MPRAHAVDTVEPTKPPREDSTSEVTPSASLSPRPTRSIESRKESKQQEVDEKKETLINQIKEQNKERKEQKLDDAKKKICEEKSGTIKTNMTNIKDVGQKREEWLTSVVDKINTFISTNNLTVENYDALVAYINTAKATFEANLQVLDTYKSQFDCSGDPKSTASDFKTALQSMKDAGKAYKDSVKALLDATKTAAQAAGITPNPKSSGEPNKGGGQQ